MTQISPSIAISIVQEPHVNDSSLTISRFLDVTTTRLQLGYRYLQKFASPADVDLTKRQRYQVNYCHTLSHYLLECCKTREYIFHHSC